MPSPPLSQFMSNIASTWSAKLTLTSYGGGQCGWARKQWGTEEVSALPSPERKRIARRRKAQIGSKERQGSASCNCCTVVVPVEAQLLPPLGCLRVGPGAASPSARVTGPVAGGDREPLLRQGHERRDLLPCAGWVREADNDLGDH